MSEGNFGEKFPDMRPMDKAPTLTSEYRVGTMLLGRRDYDAQTNTYVTTRYFCVVIPVVALGAYRVSSVPNEGYYFHGQVPLSRFARFWSVFLPLLLLVGVGLVGWHFYTDSPTYKAGQVLAEADRLAANGEGREAALLYRQVLEGDTRHAAAAHAKLLDLIDAPAESLEETAGVFEVAVDLKRQGLLVVPDLYERAVKIVKKNEERDPKGALALFDSVSTLAPRADLVTGRRRLLELRIAREPGDPVLASLLAVVCYEQGDQNRCLTALEPHKDRLGQLDGAAILGHIYAEKGRYQEAEKLLAPFLDKRLPQLLAIDRQLLKAREAFAERLRPVVNAQAAPDFPYAQVKGASEAELKSVFRDYVLRKSSEDPACAEAMAEWYDQWAVVPAAIDLGMVQLHLAQGLPDAERRKTLARAETTFLSVQSQAGDSASWNLKLARFYYLLGKPGEGRKVFDDLLRKSSRSVDALLIVADVLREVGSVTEARALAEEAYKDAKDKAKKHTAAQMRSLMYTDLDDNIAWLERADKDNVAVKAGLAFALGAKARRAGKEEDAVRHYHEALAAYKSMPETAATLNDSALVHLALYQLRHEREQFDLGMNKLTRAIAVQPSTSNLSNAAPLLLGSAVEELLRSVIDLKVLQQSATLDLLWYLCGDQEGKDKLVKCLLKQPGYLKARGYYQKLLIVAPRQPNPYSQLAALDSFTSNLEGLQETLTKLQSASVDRGDNDRETLDYYASRGAEKQRRSALEKSVAHLESALARARKAKGATFAVVVGQLAGLKMSGARMGLPVDANALVKLVKEVDAGTPSTATRGTLIQALIFRAHQTLIRQEPVYGKLASKTQRSLGALLVNFVLARGGKLAEKALANADVQSALKLQLEEFTAFHDHQEPATWAFLLAAHPDRAKEIVETTRKDTQARIKHKIDQALSPLSASVILDEHWRLLMEGKREDAEAVLKQADKRGVPMPLPELKK